MSDETYPTVPDGIPMPQRIWAVVAISIGIVMATLDSAIANIALPSIAADLHTSVAASVWVVNAYQLTIAVLLLAVASGAEIFGLRRIFWIGLAIFTVASAACGLSHSLGTLVAARVLQGVGSACIFCAYPALVSHCYPRAILGRGIGISAMIVAIASALGPTAGAAILSVAHWEWLFFVNVPLGIAGLAIGSRVLPRTPVSKRPFDPLAALVSGIVIALVIIGVDGLGRTAGRPVAIAEVAAALIVGFFLLRSQGRQPLPLVPVDLLRIPVFALSVGTSICSYAAQSVVLIALPFFFQRTVGWSAAQTGFIMTPIPLAVAVIGIIAGRLADRYPVGILCGIGLLVMAAGMASLALLSDMPHQIDVIWREILVGLGFGLFQAPNNRMLLSAGPRHRSASAGGMLATARLLGQTSGVALVAVIFEIGGVAGTPLALGAAALMALGASGISFLRMMAPKPAP